MSPVARRIVFIALVLAQALLLAGVIYTKHAWIRDGHKVLLRTAPVDPRSLMRGDYVRLNYEIEDLDLTAVENSTGFLRGEYAYVALSQGPDGVSSASGIYNEPPPGGMPFIKGRVISSGTGTHREITVLFDGGGQRKFVNPPFGWMFDSDSRGKRFEFCLDGQDGGLVNANFINGRGQKSGCAPGLVAQRGRVKALREWSYPSVRVDFTIDSYFVEEGSGREIERERNSGNVLVEAALREDGMPLISALIINGTRLR